MDSEGEGRSSDQVSTSVVTGAFGFSGNEIANRLLVRGEKVRTLTNHPQAASPLFGQVQVFPLDFGDTERLTESMSGARVLYNTYWVRFSYGGLSHEGAVHNTKTLIHAAEAAGVKRIVHVSITNPSINSPLPYFKGKAELEQAIQSSSLSYAILRPAVLFGEGDVLINNIAFMLKRFPLFAIPGSGEYHVQPIFVDNLAELAVGAGQRSDSYTVDAVGPETYTYTELVKMIGAPLEAGRCWFICRPVSFGLLLEFWERSSRMSFLRKTRSRDSWATSWSPAGHRRGERAWKAGSSPTPRQSGAPMHLSSRATIFPSNMYVLHNTCYRTLLI